MSIVEEDYAALQQILMEAGDSQDKLTEWENSFCEDLREKMEKYEVNMFLSDRQRDALRRIAEKLGMNEKI